MIYKENLNFQIMRLRDNRNLHAEDHPEYKKFDKELKALKRELDDIHESN